VRFDAILFDFDGVLADTEPIHYQCWVEILAPYGVGLDWDYYQRECIGVSDKLMVERVAPPGEFDRIWPRYAEKQALFRERMAAASPFLEETARLIAEVAATHKLAVVSSSGRAEIEPPLIAAGIRRYFETLVCGREAGELKPAPDPYLRAAMVLGAKRPLVVEDSAAGEASGKAAGFEVLRVTSAGAVPVELRRLLS